MGEYFETIYSSGFFQDFQHDPVSGLEALLDSLDIDRTGTGFDPETSRKLADAWKAGHWCRVCLDDFDKAWQERSDQWWDQLAEWADTSV